MVMKKIIIGIVFLLVWNLPAQPELYKSSLAPVGGLLSTGNIEFIDVGGETVNRETTQNNLHLSEGFLGPDIARQLGVDNYSSVENIRLFPNPATDYVEWQWQTSGKYEIYLYNTEGKEVFRDQTDQSSYRMGVSNLVPGLYILVLVDRSRQRYITRKIRIM